MMSITCIRKIFSGVKPFLAGLSIVRGVRRLLFILSFCLLLFGLFVMIQASDQTVNWVLEKFKAFCNLIVNPFDSSTRLTGEQSLAGLVLLSPFVLLVFIYIWHKIFHRRPVTDSDNVYHDADDDRPIEDSIQDKLGRESIVNHICAIIKGDLSIRSALYLGVYGKWGEGKTSVMNLVRQKFDETDLFVFVDFPVWEYGAQEDLLYVFFTRIARTVAGTFDLRLALSLFRYAVLLVPRKVVGISGPAEWIIDVLIRICNATTSVTALREKIRQRLADLNAKIVVTVDDLDRLEASDIRLVLRVLRTAGDIPRFVYCILVERDHLIRGIAEMYGAKGKCKCQKKEEESDEFTELAREYVQKIVQMEIDLPPVHVGQLEAIFVEKLSDCLKHYNLNAFPADDPVFQFFRYYVKNYRAMLRLLRELCTKIGFYSAMRNKDSEFPVNVSDLCALSIVHLYDSEFWTNIYSRQALILNDFYTPFEFYGERDVDRLKNNFDLVTSANRNIRIAFLEEYFGILFDTARYKINIDQRDAEINRRLCSVQCFKTYFEGVVPSLPAADIREQVLKRLSNEESLLEYLRTQNHQGLLMRSLEYLEDLEPLEDKKQRMSYLCAMVRLADEHLEEEARVGRDLFGFEMTYDVITRIGRCVFRMLRMLENTRKIQPNSENGHLVVRDSGSELLSIFKQTNTIVLLALAVRMDDRKDTHRQRDFIFSDNDYKELVTLFLARVKTLQKAGDLIGFSDEENLRRTWRVLLNDRVESSVQERMEYCDLLKNDVSKYPNILHLLLPYRFYGGRPVKDYSPIYFDMLARDFDVNQIYQTFNKHFEKGEWLEKLKRNFANSISKYDKDRLWPDPDQQEK